MEEKKRERRDRKEEILKEATKRFSTYGFRGTSLASIADAVGLTEPGLLHYFPSKVKLLQGVLAHRSPTHRIVYQHIRIAQVNTWMSDFEILGF